MAWFRHYAAYCGNTTTAKDGLVAVVAQLGARKVVAESLISKWALVPAPRPACGPGAPPGADAHARHPAAPVVRLSRFAVVGTSSLIEEGDSEE